MNEFQIKKATRQGIKPLVGLYAESGCGKTYSALLLARGFVGPSGKIIMIDTESGRGSLYADVLPGGYDVLELSAPFSPARYIEAMNAAAEAGAGILVVDSMSHEWEGSGGVLDMAAALEQEKGKQSLNNWRAPKMEHSKMVLALLQFPLPVIVCLRAKYKTRQTKDAQNKTVIIKDETTTPIQAEDFIFEMTAHAEILPKHNIILTKHSHPSLKSCFPTTEEGPITVEHGERLAKWCASAGETQKPTPKPATAAGKTAKKDLWELTMGVHGGNKATLQQWLVDEALIDPALTLEQLSETQISAVLTKARAKLR